MTDTRPANCRSRLRDEYKAYPKSSCEGCGRSILTGLSDECPLGTTDEPRRDGPSPIGAATTTILKMRSPSERLAYCVNKLNEQLAPSQSVVDGVALALTELVPEVLDMENRLAEKEADLAAEEDPFKLGALVVLKSRGGTLMTINAIGNNQSVEVLWFDDINHLHRAWINKDALTVKKE